MDSMLKTAEIDGEDLLRFSFNVRMGLCFLLWVICEFSIGFGSTGRPLFPAGASVQPWAVRAVLFFGVGAYAAILWTSANRPVDKAWKPRRMMALLDVLLIGLLGHFLGLAIHVSLGLIYALLLSWSAAVLSPRELLQTCVFSLCACTAVFLLDGPGVGPEAAPAREGGRAAPGPWVPCLANLAVIGAAGFVSVTLAGSFAARRRMTRLGTFATCMSHQIKTPLSTILRAVTLLRHERRRPELDIIEQHTRRIDTIVNEVMRYGTERNEAPRVLDVRELLEAGLDSVLGAGPAHVRVKIERHYPDEPVLVQGDFEWLRQGFVNLFKNALEALDGSGTVTVEIDAHRMLYVEVRIADSGPGMTEEVRARLFEPFFTTKPGGRGVGLGLAIAKGIIEGHNGRISVKSAASEGTTVVVRLPIFQEEFQARGQAMSLERWRGGSRP